LYQLLLCRILLATSYVITIQTGTETLQYIVLRARRVVRRGIASLAAGKELSLFCRGKYPTRIRYTRAYRILVGGTRLSCDISTLLGLLGCLRSGQPVMHCIYFVPNLCSALKPQKTAQPFTSPYNPSGVRFSVQLFIYKSICRSSVRRNEIRSAFLADYDAPFKCDRAPQGMSRRGVTPQLAETTFIVGFLSGVGQCVTTADRRLLRWY